MVSGVLATVIAITADSIYGLFVLCSDLMYVVLFPQLTLILWFQRSNGYGCLAGFILAFLLRILAGEPLLGLPSVLKFPLYDREHGQFFPFRTSIMLCSVATIVSVSLLSQWVFTRGLLPARYDVMGCLRQRTIAVRDAKRGEPLGGKTIVTSNQDRWTDGRELRALRDGEKAALAVPEDDDL